MKKEMLINVLQPEECRIAIVEDGILEELYVERTSHESYVGNVYKGRIVNIEPSIQAAFVDFGVGRNGFLHVSDVEPTYYRHLEPRRQDNGGNRGHIGGERRRPPEGRFDVQPQPAEHMADDQEDNTSHVQPAVQSELDEAPDRNRKRGRPRRGRRGQSKEAIRRMDVVIPGPTDISEAHAPDAGAIQDRPGDDADQYRFAPEKPPKEQFMDSAERRTDENSTADEGFGPIPDADDSDILFPRQQGEANAGSAAIPERVEESLTFTEDIADQEYPEEPAFNEDAEAFADQVPLAPLAEDEEEDRPFSRRRPPHRDDRPRGGRGGPRRFMGRNFTGRPKPLIQDIFKRGQEVLVQVIKEGIGTKGPTLSTYISIAGRYLVLMPGLNRIGVSRKIADDEQRRRLRDILNELAPPRGLGFIIRTAGLDRTKKELQRDLAYLSRLWQVVVRRIRKIKAPAEIYQESDMITRTIRDTFTGEIDSILVDEPAAFEHAQEFLQIVMPRYATRIKQYIDSEPLFHKYGIEDEIARIQRRHVPLPNGGSIVIDQTEALVAIDVNSGNFRADNNAEETAFQMNLLAAKEIARQLRLRDLGGVIVNDFIDMRDEKHRRSVERAMRDAVKRDRARTKLLRISAFGIIEMTRQRIRPSLKRSVYHDCPHCAGTGQVKTCESMSIDVMRMLQLAAHRSTISRIQASVAEEVALYLQNKKRKEISRLEEQGEIHISITGVAGAAPERLDFVCFDNNNNEVKFLSPEENGFRRN